jgi:hypothetical protein
MYFKHVTFLIIHAQLQLRRTISAAEPFYTVPCTLRYAKRPLMYNVHADPRLRSQIVIFLSFSFPKSITPRLNQLPYCQSPSAQARYSSLLTDYLN